MGAQSGANLTGVTVSSQSRELETSSVTDCDATTTPPPAGGGSVRVPIFPIVVCVRSAYVIGAGVGFRVESGAVALLQLDL